jgi:hypothetical protein
VKKAVTLAATFLVAVAAMGSVAMADVAVPPTTEAMLNSLYAGSTLVRIGDSYDQLWVSEAGNATATARSAGFNNTFGYIAGHSGPVVFTPAFYVPTGFGAITPGTITAPLPVGPGAEFRFGLDANTSGTIWSSLVSNNDGLDHMVTYYISAGAGVGNYVIAWEDLPNNSNNDLDYNDLVVTVAGARPTPEPGTMILFGSAAAGLWAWSRRSRKASVKA